MEYYRMLRRKLSATLVIGLLGLFLTSIPLAQQALAAPDVRTTISFETGALIEGEFNTLGRSENGRTMAIRVTAINYGNAPAENVVLELSQRPQVNNWYDFHQFETIEGVAPIDYMDNSVEIPYIDPNGGKTVIDFIVTLTPEDFDLASLTDNPRLLIKLDYSKLAEPKIDTIRVNIPGGSETARF
jgi:hypothetical protein